LDNQGNDEKSISLKNLQSWSPFRAEFWCYSCKPLW